jgi:hypothetical protein
MAYRRHDDLIAAPETAERMRYKGADAYLKVAGKKFFVHHNGGALPCFAYQFTMFIRIMVINGEPFHDLIAQLFAECPIIKGRMGAEGTDETHLFVPDAALLKKLKKGRDDLIYPRWPGKVIKEYADLFLVFDKRCEGLNRLPVIVLREHLFSVPPHGKDLCIPSRGE